MMTDDLALVREYARGKSEGAFSTLVARYIDLVYSVALREVRDPHLAEEVTQATFIILARKAGSLAAGTIVSGWLCRTARYAAANALTMERRRRRREHEAYMRSRSKPSESDSWAWIAPLVEPAMAHLGAQDHDAIVLRFFEGKDLKQVGAALGTSEDAARMRVNRALEKLRKFFAKRGMVPGTAVLAAALSAKSVQAAPAGLETSVSAAVTGGSTVAASTSALVKGTLKMITWMKLKTAAVVAAGVLCAAGTAAVTVKQVASRPARIALPPTVRRELAKQKAALQEVYFEYTYSQAQNGSPSGAAHDCRVYFEGSRFDRHQPTPRGDLRRVFDGKTVYMDDRLPWMHKFLVGEASADMRNFTFMDWSYLNAAGIYAPEFISQLERFSSLEPLALYYEQHHTSAKVEPVGENVRVTFQVEDPSIANVKNVDVEAYQARLQQAPNTKEWIAQEIAAVKWLQSLEPTRTVALLLDAKHGYAVGEREEWTAAGQRIVRFESQDWKYYQDAGIWLPGRCVASYYTDASKLKDFSSQPRIIVTHTLKRVEFGHKDIAFNLDSESSGAGVRSKAPGE